jgi:hypothetical protein
MSEATLQIMLRRFYVNGVNVGIVELAPALNRMTALFAVVVDVDGGLSSGLEHFDSVHELLDYRVKKLDVGKRHNRTICINYIPAVE